MEAPSGLSLDQVTGALLAGGRSRRMGFDKALLVVDGQRLVERAARALELFPQRLLVLDHPGEGALRAGEILPQWPRVYDRFPGTGPLGGLVTALAAARTPWVVLAACDMPFLTQAYYRALVERLQPSGLVLVPRWREGAEPLAGAYHREALPLLVEALAQGKRKLLDALEGLPECPAGASWLEPHVPRRLFRNINRVDEYQGLLAGGLTPGQRAYAAAEAVPLEEAQKRLLESLEPLPEEVVSLAEAQGRYTARPLRADRPIPGEARAALDGYALRSADLASLRAGGQLSLPVAGQRGAGPGAPPPLPAGAAYRVATGTVLPQGADAVVRWEEVQEIRGERGLQVRVGRALQAGEGVVPAGEETQEGELLVPSACRLDGAAMGRLAASGLGQVPVRRQPRVWLFTVGDELLPLGAPYREGCAYESNGAMLAGWLREWNLDVTVRGPIPDRLGELTRVLDGAAEAGADLILTAGGISAGPYDLVAPALEALGGRILFRRIQIHPGKSSTAAVLRGRPVVALPGHPGAAALGFWLLVRPAVARLQGSSWNPLRLRVPLMDGYPRSSRQRRFLWARLLAGPDGTPWARAGGLQRASAAGSLQGASCLVEVPGGSEPIPHGGLVTAWLLGMDVPEPNDPTLASGRR